MTPHPPTAAELVLVSFLATLLMMHVLASGQATGEGQASIVLESAGQANGLSDKAAAGLLKLIMQMSPATLRAAAKGDPAIERFLNSDEYKDPEKLMRMIGTSGILRNEESRAKLSSIVGSLGQGGQGEEVAGRAPGAKDPVQNGDL
mmetsp:Transcript_97301/g.270704  ORF Transcript_97301/g.270704 Transcript_97301/m.270704 type:complete len:147 (-) Transcript_97301:167-607(-)